MRPRFGLPANGRRSPKLRLPTLRKLFCGLRLFRGLHECISEIVYIFIHDESGDRIIQRLLKRCRSGFACSQLGTSLAVANEFIDHWWYPSNFDLSTSVRAGIEPFSGLKASCASLLPMLFSQAIVASLWGAPFARVKPSATMMNDPSVPGWLTQPKSSFSFLLALVNSPSAQSPMELNATLPSIKAPIAWSQLKAE